MSLDGQMFFIFVKSDLSTFFFCCLSFWYQSKNPLPNLKSERFIPMFSSKSFIVLVIAFRFLIHFELIFVYGVKEVCSFILLLVDI